MNFRVSTIPTVGGEKVVMRLLDEGSKTFELQHLGMSERDLKAIQTLIDRPHGMIVVTGPTGSGKSTTMYALLSKLNSVSRNIVTVEDPVEYRLPGINQVASDNEHGLGFANALKYIMRQDPDVIMVGEIRDHETASTAVQAALTGHLLISTLHANDAVGAVARLDDLGVDNFKIGGALLGSVAQRLLRQICSECKEPIEPNESLLKTLCKDRKSPADAVYYRGRGCKKCLGTGYSGRIPIYEIMVVTPALAEGIESGLPHTKLRQIALSEGMVELAAAGMEQVLAGRHHVGRSVLQAIRLSDYANQSLASAATPNADQATSAQVNSAWRPTLTTYRTIFHCDEIMRRARKTSLVNAAAISVGNATAAQRTAASSAGWRAMLGNIGKPGKAKLKDRDLVFILRNLSTLTQSGVSLPKALATLAEEKALGKASRHAPLDSPAPGSRRDVQLRLGTLWRVVRHGDGQPNQSRRAFGHVG